MEILDLLPRNRNNLIAYSFHRAKENADKATSTGLHTHNLAAKFFACATPFAAFTCGTKALSIGLWQMTVTWIRPKWAAKHINGLEEVKTGLRAFVFVPVAVTYAALSILLGPTFIQRYEINFKPEYTHEANIANCKFSGKASHHYIVNHEGRLVIRQKNLFNWTLENETVQILRETFELAKENARLQPIPSKMADFKSIIDVICRTDSPCDIADWHLLKNEASELQSIIDNAKDEKTEVQCLQKAIENLPLPDIEQAYQNILNGQTYTTQAFCTTQAIAFLQPHYSNKTVEQVFSFYVAPADHIIPTRTLHAIIIGLQANLTMDDISPQTPAELEKRRKKLPVPVSYYSDYHYIQLEKDLFFLEHLLSVEQYKPNVGSRRKGKNNTDDNSHGLAEFLSKYVVYPIYGTSDSNWRLDITDGRFPQFVEGVLFPCYYKNNKILMQVNYGITHNGLNMIEVQDPNNTFSATVFRGTGDWYSIGRDLEHPFGGVGFYSYQHSRELLLQKFHATKKSRSWHIIGHSLGGSDAMRFMASLIDLPDQLPKDFPKDLHLWTANSPKIEKELAIEFLSKVQQLHNSQKDKSEDEKVTITIHHARMSGDFIQQFGGELLGYGGENNAYPTLKRSKDVRNLPVAITNIFEYLKSLRVRHTTPMYTTGNNLKRVPYESKFQAKRS